MPLRGQQLLQTHVATSALKEPLLTRLTQQRRTGNFAMPLLLHTTMLNTLGKELL